MLPLALVMQSRGCHVSGSDRAHDQGRVAERFDYLQDNGVTLYPQNGSGISPKVDKVVISTAVEETVPDYAAAKKQNIPIITRAQLLSGLFNNTPQRIGIAGTSGKSTVTGMVGWILTCAAKVENREIPTVINGATIKNFVTAGNPFASFQVGSADTIVAEIDESDGSIAQYAPTLAVINNIAHDHKSIDELRPLFSDFANKTKKVALNLDNQETAALAAALPAEKCVTFSLIRADADFMALNLVFESHETRFDLAHRASNGTYPVKLQIPGHHNIANALAALAITTEAGVDLALAIDALNHFAGIARRYDVIGHKNKITVIDDFAHNPDKIAATLRTLHQTEGRVQLFFQPHGFAPLSMLRSEFAACFAKGMTAEDITYICDPLYFGGTTTKEVTGNDLVQDIKALGKTAILTPTREDAARAIVNAAKAKDKIVIMGARDDSLTAFAHEIFKRLPLR